MSYEEKTIPSAPMEYPKLDGYENLGQLTFNSNYCLTIEFLYFFITGLYYLKTFKKINHSS